MRLGLSYYRIVVCTAGGLLLLGLAFPVHAGIALPGAGGAEGYVPPGCSSRVSLGSDGLEPRNEVQVPLDGASCVVPARGDAVFGSQPCAESVLEMPPAPSSLALTLSALGACGIYQGLRSIRKLHLGALPDWYHSGATAQVGHATPFDPDSSSLPVCLFEDPDVAPGPVSQIPRELRLQLRCVSLLLSEAPRAPPPLL